MRRLLLLCSALLTLGPLASPSSAQSRSISVPVETSLEPITAVGLILSSERTIEKADVTREKVKDGLWVIAFKAQENELGKDSLVSAMIIAQDGSVAFGDLMPAALKGSAEQYLSLPECPSPKMSVFKMQSQASVLESLVAVRSERRQVLQASLEKELQGLLLEKAVRLEKGFGLTREEDLTGALAPLKLVDRLSRLIAAIKNNRANRETPEPAARSPAAAPTAAPQ